METLTNSAEKLGLQTNILGMQRESSEWLSATELWKRELNFYQALLDRHATKTDSVEFKKEVDHFQNLITYYNGELVDLLHKKIRKHNKQINQMLHDENESDIETFHQHEDLMDEASSFQKVFSDFKQEFFEFIERNLN